MPKIDLPWGGTAISLGTEEQASKEQRIINARAAFTTKYAREHGWPEDPTEMSIAQILEIREQPEWRRGE